MADVVKHVFKYGELRQTLYLNLAAKDDLGRHRGHVLYGMKIRPIAGSGGGATSNQISIGSGALYTPFGTKLYFDVENPAEPSINTIDLTSFMVDPSRPKPMVLGVYMKFANDPSQSAALESASDLNSVNFDLVARVVAWSRETGGPVMTLAPLNPVTMDAGTPQPLSYSHIDTSDRAAVVHNGPPTGVYEIPIGYIIVGGYTSGGIEHEPTAIYDVAGVGQWAAGVECVQLANPWENLAEFLGFDPLGGRLDASVAPDADNAEFTALSQAAGNYPIGASRMPPMSSPKMGTTVPAVANDPWDVAWSLYRLPSFFRDGEQLLWNLRRLDYMLRLWMNRTGAQGLVSIIQDGSTGLPKQAPLDKIIAAFQSGITSNLNEILFSDVETDADARHANVEVPNNALKSGFVEHLPHTPEENLSSEFGDSYEVALTALNRAVFHILTDVLGKSFDRSLLRLPASQLWRTLLTPPAGLDWTDKVGRPTLGGTALSPYLTNEALYAAIEVIAARALHGATANLLVNPNFLDDSVVPVGTVYGWSLVGGGSITRTPATSANTPLRFAVATIAIADAGSFQQTLDYTGIEGALRALVLGSSVLSASANLKVLSGNVQLRVTGYGAGSTVTFRATSPERSATTEPGDLSLSFRSDTFPAGTTTIVVELIPGAGGASVDVYGMHFGAGVPVAAPLTRDYANFLPLGAGPAYPLRNHIYGGAHQAKGFADATEAQDLTTLSQVTSAVNAEALARASADNAEALARAGGDAALGARIDALRFARSATFTSTTTWTCPTGVTQVLADAVAGGGGGGAGGDGADGGQPGIHNEPTSGGDTIIEDLTAGGAPLLQVTGGYCGENGGAMFGAGGGAQYCMTIRNGSSVNVGYQWGRAWDGIPVSTGCGHAGGNGGDWGGHGGGGGYGGAVGTREAVGPGVNTAAAGESGRLAGDGGAGGGGYPSHGGWGGKGGGGGAAGERTRKLLTVVPGHQYRITVGAGGNGGLAGSGVGSGGPGGNGAAGRVILSWDA